LPSFPKHKRIGLISLGCAKNLVDSEVLLRQFEVNHIEITVEPENTKGLDAVIVNTCGFIRDAKQESIDTILELIREKERGQIKAVYVMGCLSQRYRNDLISELPEVDGFFGVNDLPEILSSLNVDYQHTLVGERVITTPSHYAYLKIAEGCDRTCAFCAIPGIRGKHISRPEEEILKEAEWLANKGVKELILISQDTTYYGLDLYKERRLSRLLQNLALIPGIRWIRLHYTYPQGFPKNVLEVMASEPKICKYLDIPLQHIHTGILKSMQRNITGRNTRELLKTIREMVPGIAVRTTLIVGYPGETDEQFNDLVEFIREEKFERLGAFIYSHEEDTPAFSMEDNVPVEIKQQRLETIMRLQANISMENNLNQIGRILPVMIDRQEGNFWIGRTEYDSPEVDQEVVIQMNTISVTPGEICQVRITQGLEFTLEGIIVA